MKAFLAIISIIVFAISIGAAQPCRQVNLDSTQRSILRSYISESVKEGAFVGDKGVVVITRFTDEGSGKAAWKIHILLDDKYKDNPPLEWARLGRDVVLFYDAKSRDNINKATATPQLLSCLDEVIEDRLYIRPPQRERLMTVDVPNGKPLRVSSRRISGNTRNEQTIIFLGDGKVRIYSSV